MLAGDGGHDEAARHGLCLSVVPSLSSQEARSQFQDLKSINALVCIMRVKNRTDDVKRFLAACPFAELGQLVRDELKALQQLSNPWDDTVSTERLKALQESFQTDGSKQLHKSMLVLGTAIQIMDEASTVVLARNQNAQLLQELNGQKLPTMDWNTPWIAEKQTEEEGQASTAQAEKVEVPSLSAWNEVAINFLKVSSKATAFFKGAHGMALGEVETACLRVCNKAMSDAEGAFVAFAQGEASTLVLLLKTVHELDQATQKDRLLL